MKQIATILFSLLLVFTFFGTAEGQTTIAEQDFDSGTSWGYTTSITTFDDGWGSSYFGVIDINSASPLNKAEFSSNIFGENDLNSTNGTSGFANITFNEVDISSNSNVEISFDYQVIGYNANNDDARYEVFHDGVGQGQVDLHDGSTDTDDSEDSIVLSIPNTVNDIHLVLYVRNNGQTGYSGFDNFELAESTIEPEPTNHVSNFIATSNSISSIDLSWTDAATGTAPENYLILINESGSFATPSDGTEQSDDTDLSDGTGVLNIAQGIETATVSGLESNTQYYFEIYPYTNLGSNIDYKIDGTIPSTNISTLEKPDLVLNEILADPPDGSEGDSNNDGTRNSDDDEFLEFVNTGQSDLDISDWKIINDDNTRHTFPENTVLKPYQGIVVFGGGNPSGNFGSSIVQTTGSLDLLNGGETVAIKDATNNTLIEVTYSGASDQSRTRNPDLTGTFEDHTSADTDDGSEFSPGTRVDGSKFQPSVIFEDGEGWRMIASPTQENSYQDLLFNIWTQCSANADYNGSLCSSDPNTQPNVLTYGGSDFVNVGDLDDSDNNSMTPGQGFIVYVFSDDDYDKSATDAGFPKHLDLFGVPNSGSINASLNTGIGTFSLVGNPYNEPIDWDLLDTSDFDGTIYVYDHTYGSIDGIGDDEAETRNNVGGGYRTWNESGAGSLASGIIAPFQGFWIESNEASPSLTFEESAQTTVGTFYTKENNHVISLRLRSEMENMYSEAFLSFSETGQLEDDKNDGLKLSPLDFRNYMSLSTEVEGTQMDINNLPVELYNPVEIPLHVQAFEAVESGWSLMSGEVTLSWPEMNNIPSEWEITLKDTQLNRTIDLKSANNYVFEAEGSQAKIANKEPFSPFNPKPFQKEKAVNDARFLITINPNVPDGLIDDNIPDQFTLEQNYPNPFNPSTNIKFEIAETSDVALNVYNLMGQRVATLVNEVKAPGTYEIAWNAQEMASGIYYYRLQAGGVVFNRQMTLIK